MQREEFKEILESLRKHFPGAFPEKGFRIFKKGIDLDICKSLKIVISRTKLRVFFKIYTSHPLYTKAHIIGAKRYDLEGRAVGVVTEIEHQKMQEIKQLKLKRKNFLKKQRLQQEKAQQPQQQKNQYKTKGEQYNKENTDNTEKKYNIEEKQPRDSSREILRLNFSKKINTEFLINKKNKD